MPPKLPRQRGMQLAAPDLTGTSAYWSRNTRARRGAPVRSAIFLPGCFSSEPRYGSCQERLDDVPVNPSQLAQFHYGDAFVCLMHCRADETKFCYGAVIRYEAGVRGTTASIQSRIDVGRL